MIAQPFWKLKDCIFIDDGVVLLEDRLVVPEVLKQEMLERLHEGHNGMTKTRELATQYFYWNNINNDITEFIRNCQICQKYQKQNVRAID